MMLRCGYMTIELEALLLSAQDAVGRMRMGALSYDEARAIVERYIVAANAEGKLLAKKYGMRFKPMSAIGFMR